MTGPRASVRISFTDDQMDGRWLSCAAVREVYGLLYDAPSQVLAHIDLGPLRQVDANLLSALATVPCAPNLRFESSDWRTAQNSALELTALLAPVEVIR